MSTAHFIRRTALLLWVVLMALVALLAGFTGGVAHAAPGEVLILDSTVSGGMSSLEAQKVVLAGKTPVVVNAATWGIKTTTGQLDSFDTYDAIVLGDPTCGTAAAFAAAEANRTVWGPAITGNVIIIGTDPVVHQAQGGAQMVESGIKFAVSAAGKTGAYISLSCAYSVPAAAVAASSTPVPLLSTLSTQGGFIVSGASNCSNPAVNDAHIVAPSHPALAGLTDASLSNWNCSAHEWFESFPADFLPLVIAKDVGPPLPGSLHFPDGSSGVPYVLSRSACVPPPSGMVAWWPLDEQTGAVVQDILGFDNNGAPQPGAVGGGGPTPITGQVNGALYFVNNYIEVPPATNLNLANSDLTIDGWFAWGLPGSPGFGGIPNWSPGQTIYDAIVDKLNPSTTPNSGYALFVRTQATPLPSPPQTGNPVTITVELVFALGNNLYTAQIYSGTTTFPPPSGQYPPPTPPWPYGGQWLHVAVTVDRSTGIGTFYLNGNSVGNFTPAAGVNNTAPLWIGKSRLPVNGMEFALDEIEIFNRALDQSEIQAIYNAGSAGKCREFVNLAITPTNPTTSPLSVTYAVSGCSGREMFLVLDASAAPNAVPGLVPFPWSYLNTSGAWQPLPTPLSLITPWMSSGPADDLYTLFSGSVPTGQYTLYLGCDFVPNGHLDIDANLNVNGVYDALNVTVQ